MRVLVACEFSGRVRDAFRRRGHDAISCDLVDSWVDGPHIKGDVRSVLYDGSWDMLIAFPPCTYLTTSGNAWAKDPARIKLRADALDFVMRLLNAPIPRIALENPIGVISTAIRKPDQIIQPWQFGHAEQKATCLWLKNLPRLRRTKIASPPFTNLTPSGQNKLGPSKLRQRLRALTYYGVADAMAEQWGNLTP